MEFESLNNKEVNNGKLRLTEPSILFSDNVGYIATHTVTLDEVCRPDLISDKYYRSTDYVDYILKYNKISNPFSIAEGDTLLIPDVDAVKLTWKRVKPSEYQSEQMDSIRAQFLDTKRLPVKDAKRVEYLKKKAAKIKNGSKEILPPNILKSGDTNIDITDDSITI